MKCCYKAFFILDRCNWRTVGVVFKKNLVDGARPRPFSRYFSLGSSNSHCWDNFVLTLCSNTFSLSFFDQLVCLFVVVLVVINSCPWKRGLIIFLAHLVKTGIMNTITDFVRKYIVEHFFLILWQFSLTPVPCLESDTKDREHRKGEHTYGKRRRG